MWFLALENKKTVNVVKTSTVFILIYAVCVNYGFMFLINLF